MGGKQKKKKKKNANAGQSQPRDDSSPAMTASQEPRDNDDAGNQGACAQEPEEGYTDATATVAPVPLITQNITAKNVQIGDHNLIKERDRPIGKQAIETAPDAKEDIRATPIDVEHNVALKSGSYADAVKNTQHITANVVNVSNNFVQHGLNSNLAETEPKRRSFSTAMGKFLDAVGDFRNGHYILIAGKTSRVKHLEALSLVPWIAVIDFDPESQTNGLLSCLEDKMRRSRQSLHLLSWQDKCSFTVNEESTCWIFANGQIEMADSRMHDAFTTWKDCTKEGIRNTVKQIQTLRKDTCTGITIVIIWPNDASLVQRINHVLYKMTKLGPKVVLTENYTDDPNTEKLCSSLELQGFIVERVEISIDEICESTSYFIQADDLGCNSDYRLPTGDCTNDAGMTHEDANYLQEELIVLYIDNKTGVKYTLDMIKEEEDTFLRGGTLPWAFRYETSVGQIDIERDILLILKSCISTRHIKPFRPGLVNLYHAPGSGGTTLAQRVLWDLHDTTPCVEVKYNPASTPQSIADKIELLSDKTRLPILVMIDGEEEQKVERIREHLCDTCVIILYVKRHAPDRKQTNRNTFGDFWLSQYVSPKEANCLGAKYMDSVEEKVKHNIRKLVHEVIQNKDRMIFDFGLTAHDYEYKGIQSYVRGFLKLGHTSHATWQKALVFLSLAHYYGHTGIPCNFFSKLLLENEEHVMTFADFPDEMKEFIVKVHHVGRSHVVRISHYLVAKEILDQLPGQQQNKKRLLPTISPETKKKITPLARSFIEYSREVEQDDHPSNLSKIVTNIFFTRDNKRIGENEPEAVNRRKRPFSQILDDVSSNSPFTERFDIIEQLVTSYPYDALVRAHLGRLYAICRPELEVEAERCFEHALTICHKQKSDLSNAAVPVHLNVTLSHVHHMFGNMFLRRAQCPCRQTSNSKDQFYTDAKNLLKKVTKACENYEKCREVTPEGMEESYGYIGEIEARLLFCEYIRSYLTIDVLEYSENALKSTSDVDNLIGEFIKDTLVTVDQLLIDLLPRVTERCSMDDRITHCQRRYASLFRKCSSGHSDLAADTAVERRFQIALRKAKFIPKRKPCVDLDHVTGKEDIEFIVKAYEKNIDEAFNDNSILRASRRQLDIDHREWLFAIRNKLVCDKYTIDKVLQDTQRWYDELKTPYSRFYLFSLKSILGFGSQSAVNNELLKQAASLKEEMMKNSKFMTKPRCPHEWLGSAKNGIKRLAPGSRFVNRQTGRSDATSDFQILKGTIFPPNDRPSTGMIKIDLPQNCHVPVKAFFIPVACEMKGRSFARKRVQFELAFTMAHGYEAFNVKLLPRSKCTNCERSNVEFRYCDDEVVCPSCGATNRRKQRMYRK